MGSGLPWSRVRRSLGSRMSIPEGPPCMKRKMTRLALGLKWGGRLASGFPEGEASRPRLLGKQSGQTQKSEAAGRSP